MPALDQLFGLMITEKASDLHLHEGQPPKMRIDGHMRAVPGAPVLTRAVVGQIMEEICPPEKWLRFEDNGDLDFAYAFGDTARFRVNYARHYFGLGAVFRTIPSRILSLAELGAPDVLRTFAHFTSGLSLVTGPTGSGKSTTLAAVLDYINSTQKRMMLTIEEPIEFVHPLKNSTIVQREVGTDAHTFADGLKGALREDVEVVLVGEMRDLETISLALTAGEMGLRVFGTLHTNSATKTIDRIIDVFPHDQQDAVRDSLATALRAVCAQTLLRRKKGGRVAAHEILLQTRAVSNLIREGKVNQLPQTMMSNRAMGMQMMDDAIEKLLQESIITGEEAYMKASEKERFAQFAPRFES